MGLLGVPLLKHSDFDTPGDLEAYTATTPSAVFFNPQLMLPAVHCHTLRLER